jgi:phage shock protein PspC (stress-responsive transcriptional regulator)
MTDDPALERVKAMFAAGRIDEIEYDQLMEALRRRPLSQRVPQTPRPPSPPVSAPPKVPAHAEPNREVRRDLAHAWMGGVCAGIANTLSLPPRSLRAVVIFVLVVAVISGWGTVAYFGLWVIYTVLWVTLRPAGSAANLDSYPLLVKLGLTWVLFGAFYGTMHRAWSSLAQMYSELGAELPQPARLFWECGSLRGIQGWAIPALLLGLGALIFLLRKPDHRRRAMIIYWALIGILVPLMILGAWAPLLTGPRLIR